jgi:hypothetical protein
MVGLRVETCGGFDRDNGSSVIGPHVPNCRSEDGLEGDNSGRLFRHGKSVP